MSLQPVICNNKDLINNIYKSSLKSSGVSGVGTITVYDTSQFAVNKILLIGEMNSESSLIIKTHASTAPVAATGVVTLASNLTKDFPKDTPVYIIPFDQIEFSWSATLTGAKSVLGSVVNIDPGQDNMLYEDTTNTTGYYFIRYKNSITGVYSDYSDGVPYTGLPENTVGYAIDSAMNEIPGAKFSDKLTYSMFIVWAQEMLHLVRGKLKKWSEYKEPDYVFGTMSMGVRRWAMPDSCYDKNSNKSMINLQVGKELPLTWIDWSEYLQATEGAVYTEVATQAEIGATSLVLDDTSDLDDTGSVDVYVSGTKYTITYTANTRSTNTLTVASTEITAILPVDSQVWQGVTEDDPEYYTIADGYVYTWPMITSDYEGRNLNGSFYTDIVDIDSDMDVIYGPRYDMLKHYFKWKIRAILNNKGKEDMKDPSYQQFKEILGDAVRTEDPGERSSFGPRGNAIYGGRSRR